MCVCVLWLYFFCLWMTNLQYFIVDRKSEDVKPNPMYLYQRDITDEYIEQKFGSYSVGICAQTDNFTEILSSTATHFPDEKKLQRNPPNILRRNKPTTSIPSTIKVEVSTGQNFQSFSSQSICFSNELKFLSFLFLTNISMKSFPKTSDLYAVLISC